MIKAFALAEAVSIPVMVCYDGYLLSHTYMPFEVPDEKKVAQFLPPFKPAYALDPADPANLNTVTLPDVRMDVNGELAHGYMEIRYLLQEDLRGALTVAQENEDEFKKIFGRGGDALLEPYRCDDAEHIVVGLGSLTYQLRDVVDALRAEGLKVGVLGVRLYRPFPDEALAAALRRRAPGDRHREGRVLRLRRRALLRSQGGAVRHELGSDRERGAPIVRGLIAGIGGRDIRTADLTDTLRAAISGAPDDGPDWIGLKL